MNWTIGYSQDEIHRRVGLWPQKQVKIKFSFLFLNDNNNYSQNMRFYKFNRNRSLDPIQKYRISENKANYLASRGKLKVLDSIFT